MLTASSSAWVLALKCQHSAANAGFGLPDVAALQQGKVTRASAWVLALRCHHAAALAGSALP
jgi:hypothetical protein